MILYCCTCGKQVVSYIVPRNDTLRTIHEGAKAAIKPDECFCGYCAELLDENGLFPEERYEPYDY